MTRLLFDLSHRVKLRITGADRLRYLNGQITNDLCKASDTRAIEACVLNAKGRIEAHLFVRAGGESFLIDADARLRDKLPARLERYIIADDVQVEDVSDAFALFHVTGERPETIAAVESQRFGEHGFDVWTSAAERERALQELRQRWSFCDDDCTERLRIARALPRWGCELSDEILPHEANLEARCVDYAKGCYVGQEVVSRMKMSGQTNKRLVTLSPMDGAALAAGTQLVAEGKQIGCITSVADDRALGFVKRGFNDTGAELNTAAGARVRITS